MYITRYTEESFSTLISLIFITDGFKKLFHIAASAPLNFFWRQNSATHYDCSCHIPKFPGSIQKWTESLSELDWMKNASDRIIMHGKEPNPERFWKNNNQYHCIYLNDYKLVDLNNGTSWTDQDTEKCRSFCGVLDGAACPLYKNFPVTTASIENNATRSLIEQAMRHEGVELSNEIISEFGISHFGKIFTPDVFFFSLFLAFGTLAISFTLKARFLLFFISIMTVSEPFKKLRTCSLSEVSKFKKLC